MAYKKRTEKNRGIYIAVSILVFFAVAYLFINSIDAWAKYKESKRRLTAVEQSYQNLELQYENLQKLKKIEESETGYEMQVRSKFDLVKLDEKTVFITNDVALLEPEEQKTITKKFLNIFKNFFD